MRARAVWSAVAWLAWAGVPGGVTGQVFAPDARVTLKAGSSPAAALIVDVNRDGSADIIVANGGDGSVSIFLGDGSGTFREAVGSPAPAGRNPNDLAAADFNRDGLPDLAIANHDTDYVTVLLGDGRGAFRSAPGSPLRVPSRPHPHGIAAGDLNGDRHPDLVIDSWEEDALILIWGDGRGRFSIRPRIRVGDHPYHKVRVGDVNQDGGLDIVTANLESDNVTVLLAKGSGRFTDAPGSPYPSGNSPFGVAIGDATGDGAPDVAVVNYSGSIRERGSDAIRLLVAERDGTFRAGSGAPFVSGHAPTSIAMGDVNGDGVLDIAAGNLGSNDVTVLIGGPGGLRAARGSPYAVGRTPASVALGDLDGDRRADLVACNSADGTISILLTRGRRQ